MAHEKLRVIGGHRGGNEVNYRAERTSRMALRLHAVGERRVLVPTYWPPELTPALLAAAKIYGVNEYDWPREVRLQLFGPEKDWPFEVAWEMPF